jgi:exonuclease VII large subunit
MKRATLLALLLSLAVSALALNVLSPAQVLKDLDKYDEKVVTVAGKVSEFTQKKSRAGNPYFTFKLKEGESVIHVYSRGEAEKELKNGVEVHVTGIFRKEKKMQNFTVKNELDASKEEEKPYGVKIAPKAKDDK